jgi:hypothetical protein
MSKNQAPDESWSNAVAVLAADALVDGGVIDRSQLARATEIIAEEIEVRLICGDYPPIRTSDNQGK